MDILKLLMFGEGFSKAVNELSSLRVKNVGFPAKSCLSFGYVPKVNDPPILFDHIKDNQLVTKKYYLCIINCHSLNHTSLICCISVTVQLYFVIRAGNPDGKWRKWYSIHWVVLSWLQNFYQFTPVLILCYRLLFCYVLYKKSCYNGTRWITWQTHISWCKCIESSFPPTPANNLPCMSPNHNLCTSSSFAVSEQFVECSYCVSVGATVRFRQQISINGSLQWETYILVGN